MPQEGRQIAAIIVANKIIVGYILKLFNIISCLNPGRFLFRFGS